MGKKEILKRAKADPIYRKKAISQLKKASERIVDTPSDMLLRYRIQFIREVQAGIVKTLKDYDWDPTWIPEKKIIGVIGEREEYSLQFRWAKPGDPSDWGISVNYSGTKRQVWDFPAEYSIPSEVAEAVIRRLSPGSR